jgi:hypothetical protein
MHRPVEEDDDHSLIVTKPRSMTVDSLSVWQRCHTQPARSWLSSPVVIDEPYNQDLACELKLFIPIICWLVYLTVTAVYTRCLCLADIPYDCPSFTSMRAMNGVSELYAKGVTIFIFARMGPNEILYKWYFYVINLVTILVFGVLGGVLPGLYLEVGNTLSVMDTVFLCCMIAVMVAMGMYHVRLAWKIHIRCGVMYLLVLLSLLMFYVLKTMILLNQTTIHVHHAFLFWVLSWFCRYKPIPSQICLAVTTGIFIQGVSVYGTTGDIA